MSSPLFFIAATGFLLISSLPIVDAQTLVADYQVQDIYNSSVGTIGPLMPIGFVEFVPATVDGQMQQVINIETTEGPPPDLEIFTSGVQTQTSPFLNPANYSAVLLANFNLNPLDIVATKIMDFKNLSTDAGLYVNAMSGTMAFIDDTAVVQGTGGAALSSFEYVQIVLTRDDTTDVVSVYLNGMLAFMFTDTMNLAVMADSSMSGNAFLSLFLDDAPDGFLVNETTQGNIARLRLYDGVLSPEQVEALDRVIPEPSTWSLLFAGAGALALAIRRRTSRR